LAGKAFYNGSYSRWIRPITDRPTHALETPEHRITTGEDSKLLDILAIQLLEPRPNEHQQENWLMNVGVPLTKVGEFSLTEIHKLLDSPDALWSIGSSSSSGLNDRVPYGEISELENSLYLVQVENFKIERFFEVHPHNRVTTRGAFSYGGQNYRLKITDPVFELEFNKKPAGIYDINKAVITLSLGEVFNNHCYKLIAGIIPL
jgi:hypothetical protein